MAMDAALPGLDQVYGLSARNYFRSASMVFFAAIFGFDAMKKTPLQGIYYTYEIDGRPTFVVVAERYSQALELTTEQWLKDELCRLQSDGVPICTAASKLSVRQSSPEEMAMSMRDAANAATEEGE